MSTGEGRKLYFAGNKPWKWITNVGTVRFCPKVRNTGDQKERALLLVHYFHLVENHCYFQACADFHF